MNNVSEECSTCGTKTRLIVRRLSTGVQCNECVRRLSGGIIPLFGSIEEEPKKKSPQT